MKLRIEKPIYGGAGLAREGGKAVFVPFTLPGETVEARIAEDHGGYAQAELEAVIEPSPARVAAPCPSFGACGGCHYQHAGYAAQVEMKRSILRETLDRAHIRDIPEIAALTGEPLGYRNRIRLHVERNPFRLGYKLRKSRITLPIDVCPIAAPALERAIGALHRAGADLGLAALANELELFTNADQSSLLLSLWTSCPAGEAQRLLAAAWPGLRDMLPALTGAGVFSALKHRAPSQLLARAGDPWLMYAVAGSDYRVSLGSFFQANRFLLDSLVRLVTDGELGDNAWDLYAGVGLFSLPLASIFAELTAVESAAGSVRDLRENLRSNGPRPPRVVAADTAAFLRRAVEQPMAPPDLVVVDPPRAGLDRDVTTHLGKLRSPRITYVSCDPSTLSRDLAALLESGYRLRRLHLVDLFPQTYHMETVAHLTLG
ncbi:MAG TPA: class I SAM-dependent RNA methyltransferase [Acidobacteriaceae bacterium]